MNELLKIEIFNHPEFGKLRTITEDDRVLFCAGDIARTLGYTNISKAINDHCKGVTKRYTLTNGGKQQMNFIPEGDVYRLAARSQLPSAERFESWIFDDVLPTIRKHGIYATPETIDKIIAEPENAIKIFTALKEEREKRIAAENALQEAQPKLTYYEKILASKGNMRITQIAKDYGMSAQRLNKLLNEAGLIWKVGNQWVLYAKYDRQGYTDTETIEYADGKCSTVRTLWTQRGRLKIHQILTSKGIVANCDRNKQFKVNTVGKQVEFNATVAARNLA